MNIKVITIAAILLGIIGVILINGLKSQDAKKNSTYNSEELSQEYKGSHMTINDEVIDKNDPYRVIEPLWWNCNIYDGEKEYYSSLEGFSKEQIYVFAIIWYEAEVNNGGHDQFYFNSTGVVWQEALEGFNELDLTGYLEIITESIRRMEDYPIKDRYRRQEQMDKLKVDFDDLDRLFYNNEVNLNSALQKYIKSNREKFYFDGIVNKPTDNR